MGSIFHVPVARTDEDAARRAGAAPGAGLSARISRQASIDYREADYGEPLVLLMGNEQQGLTRGACRRLRRSSCAFPCAARADSLNLAVSTGLMVYEALRRTLR